MATYYVDPVNGNDGDNGLSWANAKLTLNGAENIPVVAGDIVYCGPGVYRELLTVDVSGAAGSPITYIGDITGENTDGIGGIVRITGSDNDQSATRANCINSATQRNYRTFRGFTMDTTTAVILTNGNTCGTNWIVEDCTFQNGVNAVLFQIAGNNQSAWTIRRCVFRQLYANNCLYIYGSVQNSGHVIENCIIQGGVYSFNISAIGGITIRGCTLWFTTTAGVYISGALPVGYTAINVNSCVLTRLSTAVRATALGELVEDYNTFYGNSTDRTNVAVGANSLTYPPLFDLGLLHAGASQVSGFMLPRPRLGELTTWSQVRAVADGGTNAALDISGLARPVTDGKRSWGAAQYPNVGRETTTVHGGSVALRLDDAGRRQFWIPCVHVQTTISVWCYREADYAGNNPAMIIKQAGQADRTTTDAGGAGAWNQLTDTFTPAADPEWLCVELVSQNTDAANPATNDAFFDDLTVTLGTLGDMETWLWDTETADWVAATGVACDYPAEEDVEAGVVYGSGAYTGTLVCVGRTCSRWPDYVPCRRTT